MFQLKKGIIVDWYLSDPMDIEFRGRVGIFGPNGSGKSSLLDFLQVVMVGAHSRWFRLNASASDSKKSRGRSVRDYCLGMVGDRKEGGKPMRDVADTRLALVFERPETNEVHTIGVVIHAEEGQGNSKQDKDNFSVECRFIAQGVELSCDDFVDWQGDEYEILDWDIAQKKIQQKADRFEPYNTSEKFVKSFLALLRGDNRADVNTFIGAFRNAVAFRPIENVCDFVRQFILEENPIKIDAFRDSVRAYEELNGAIQKLEKREEELKDIESALASYRRTRNRSLSADWLSTSAQHLLIRRKYRNANFAYSEGAEAIIKKENIIEVLEDNLENDQSRHHKLELLLNENSGMNRLNMNKLEIDRAKLELEGIYDDFSSLRGAISRVLGAQKHMKLDEADLLFTYLERLEQFMANAGGITAHIKDWTKERLDVASYDNAFVDVNAKQQKAIDIHENILAERVAHQSEVKTAESDLAKARSGAVPLSEKVETLFWELKGAGFFVDHLHSLVTVKDDQWQDVIEAVLGGSRETLFVREKDLQGAMQYLRENRKRFIGCRIFNNNRVQKFGTESDANTLAGLIETDDIRVRAFLNIKLGNIQAVETTSDLALYRRAATKDCMYNDGASITSIRRQKANILGLNTAQMLPILEGRLQSLNDEFPEIRAREKKAELAKSAFVALLDFKDTVLTGYDALYDRKISQEEKLFNLQEDRELLKQDLPQDLISEFEQLNDTIPERKREIKGSRGRLQTLIENQAGLKNELDRLYGKRQQLLNLLIEKRKRLNISLRSQAKDLWDREIESGLSHKKVSEKYSIEAENDARKLSGLWRDFISGITTYCVSHKRPQPSLPDDVTFSEEKASAVLSWLNDEKDAVVGHNLREHRTKALDAQETMEDIFKTDFLAALCDRFNQTKDDLERINKKLKQHKFNQESYKFIHKANPEFDEIIELVNVTNLRPELLTPLFQATEANQLGEDAHLFKAMQRVKALLSSDEIRVEDFEDYRDYHNFEVVVLDNDGNTKTTLSSRQEIGSGGEQQVPFYVSIAASLASMYHGRMSSVDTQRGLALTLFDEAFNKLDSSNMSKCMSFFEKLSLQVILAAPDEKRMEFIEHLDTVIDIERNRDRDSFMISVSYPGQALKDALRNENPAYMPIESFRDAS